MTHSLWKRYLQWVTPVIGGLAVASGTLFSFWKAVEIGHAKAGMAGALMGLLVWLAIILPLVLALREGPEERLARRIRNRKEGEWGC